MRHDTKKYDRLTNLVLADVENTEMSIKAIAAKHSTSVAFVHNRCKEYGIVHGRKQGSKLTPSQIKEILRLTLEGVPAAQLSEQFKVNPVTIHKHRKDAGIEIPKQFAGVTIIKCRKKSAALAKRTAYNLGVSTASFVSEAIEHFVNYLNS